MTTEATHWNIDRGIGLLRRVIRIAAFILIGLLIIRFLVVLFQFGVSSSLFLTVDPWLNPVRDPFLGWVGQEIVRVGWHVDIPSLLAVFAIAFISEFLQWILHFFYGRR